MKIWKKRFNNRIDHVTSLNCASFTEASDKFADYFASVAVDSAKSHLYEQLLYKYENYALSHAKDTFLTEEDVRLVHDKLSFDKSGGANGLSGKHCFSVQIEYLSIYYICLIYVYSMAMCQNLLLRKLSFLFLIFSCSIRKILNHIVLSHYLLCYLNGLNYV